MKKIFITFLILFAGLCAYAKAGTSVTYTIDPVKNAYEHNNMGIIYMEEKAYAAAIQEFKMAISLNPKTQATAVYFNNLGKVYMTIGYPNYALDCFQNAITQYNLNFDYYKNLVECYKALGKIDTKLSEYKTKQTTPLDKVILGLLYEQKKNYKRAIITLDDFVMSEPDLLITPAVKNHIQELVDKNNEL